MFKIEFNEQQLFQIIRQAVAAELDARKMSAHQDAPALASRRSMDIDEFCTFTGFAKQTAYKLTATNKVPFSKQGKRIFFDRNLVENWLLENRRATGNEAAAAASDYITSAPRRNRNR